KVDVRNDRGRARVSVDVSGYFVGGVKVTAAEAGNCVTAKDAPGFASAFDGRVESDVEGWRSTGPNRIKAEGCELVTDTGTDVSWYTAHTYQNNYTLKIDWKATSDTSDSGVFVLFPNPGDDQSKPATAGYEIQIGPKNATSTLQTGGMVGLRPPTTTAPVKPTGEWNTYEITVRWNTAVVLLNGQKVNEYTSADGSAVARDTYFGLQNSGANSPVKFRNIRVKRDTPVRSGGFVGVNDRCLDVLDGNPFQSVIRMSTCTGGFAQVWTETGDGTIRAGGRCLTAKDAGVANGTSAVLGGCEGNISQDWLQRQDGRLINTLSGRCLTPVSGDQGAALQLQDCNLQRTEQVWRLPDQRGVTGKLVGPGGHCLDVFGSNPLNTVVGLDTCTGNVAQTWSAVGDGTLRGEGKCLDVQNAGVAEGTSVILWECNGNQAQQWVEQADGTLVNPVSGRCLTSSSSTPGALPSISTCVASDRQVWRMTAETVVRGNLVGIGANCIDVAGNDPGNASKVWAWDCYGPGGQMWYGLGDGTLRAFGKCLDVTGTANFADVVVAACVGGESQQWTARYNGTIVNALANRCVDDYFNRTDNGTAIILHDCHAGANQRWSTPIAAS
ncbi:MAG: ricin-type beta-trefoil lectin domain protein, partial [Umezawaea sp.]